jgi:hypothetical protein
VLDNGRVDAVLLSTLVDSVNIAKAENLTLLVAESVHMMAKSDLVFCQCSSLRKSVSLILKIADDFHLITAQHCHSAKVLDRVQTLDNRLFLSESKGTPSQVCIDNGRQHLRNETYGHRYAEEGSLSPVSSDLATDHQNLPKSVSCSRWSPAILTMGTSTNMKTIIM